MALIALDTQCYDAAKMLSIGLKYVRPDILNARLYLMR